MILTNRRNFQNDALFKRLTFAIQFLNSLNIKSLLEIIIIYIYVLQFLTEITIFISDSVIEYDKFYYFYVKSNFIAMFVHKTLLDT